MKKHTILVVDDEPANQFLLDGLLTAHEYNPVIASSGMECLEILKQELPDLILLDIMMPKMTGLEALTSIIQDDNLKHIPVIMVSAKTASSDIQEALNMGAIDYIKKPFDEMELLARVRVGIRLKENEDSLRDMINLRNNFVKIVSHDLRSPFTAIHGFAELLLLKGENLSDDQKDSIQYIVQAVEYSDDYFNKLLSWTMLDHGDLELARTDFSVKSVIDGLLRVFERKASDKQVKIENLIDESYKINADETFFRQVVSNLINNALKFTPEGGIIQCYQEQQDGSSTIVIADNGVGMPAEITPETLFGDSILQSTKGTKGEKGTGIGLSICKKILDAHQFGFSFRRKPDSGTEFLIQIQQ